MRSKRIPMLDLTREVELLRPELQAAIDGVLRSGSFIQGPNVKALEAEIADYLHVKHAIAVNSGTDALIIGLKALGLEPGDEVITTPFTFFATAEAISLLGATPVFVDVEEDTFNIDPERLEGALSPRTKAILPVHIFGQPAQLEPIMSIAEEHGLPVLEDVAQAFGADYRGQRTGTFGRLGAFSFFPSKNLGAYGDGGLMATGDDDVADVARMLGKHGSRKKYYNEKVGYNSRLDEIQAAILRVKLPHIDEWNLLRRAAAARYDQLLKGVPGIITPPTTEYGTHVYHQYTIRVQNEKRDFLREVLAEAGIETMIYYPLPVHELPVYRGLYPSLPISERLATQVLSLPIGPFIQAEEQELIADIIRRNCA